MNWSDLLPDVHAFAPGVPEPVAEGMLRRSAIKFCRLTHVWVEELSPIVLVEGVKRYKLSVPEQTECLAVSDLRYENDQKVPLYAHVNIFGLLTFMEMPGNLAGRVKPRIVLSPLHDAPSIPDRIGFDYREGIVAGALEFLVSMPNKNWSNPQMIPYYQSQFAESVNEAKYRRANGNNEQSMRVAPRHLL